MEDNLNKSLADWMKSTQEELKRMQEAQDNYKKDLTEEQRKELDEAMKNVDMDEINKVIEQTTKGMFEKINNMFG